MALNAIRGTGLNLNAFTPLSLAPAQAWTIPPGTWNVALGLYTFIETYNVVTQSWLPMPGMRYGEVNQIESDGVNYRLTNRTGCPVGATVTNAGSGYTSVPTVTAPGGSKWTAILGGLLSTTVTVTTGGSYNYVPTLYIPPPAGQGYQANATATVSGGAITAVTVINQGAGYTTAPPVVIIPDPRETGTQGGVLTATIATGNSQALSAVICTDFGTTAQTSVPALTFSGGGGSSAAATAIMVLTATTISASTGLGIIGEAALPSATWANPAYENNIYAPRLGWTQYNSAAVILDGGLCRTHPQGWSVLATVAALTVSAYGGTTDTVWLQNA